MHRDKHDSHIEASYRLIKVCREELERLQKSLIEVRKRNADAWVMLSHARDINAPQTDEIESPCSSQQIFPSVSQIDEAKNSASREPMSRGSLGWLDRAKESRLCAGRVHDYKVKRCLLDQAEAYEKIAERSN
ncbi:MAG: hypothetical protein WBX25_17245 [Rhodomicrobium sp.]